MIHILGGGTFSHIRSHMAICAPAFGHTAKAIHEYLYWLGSDSELHLTKMADSESDIVTNKDVADLINRLLDDPATTHIIMNAALCDFDGKIGDVESGKYAPRLKSREGEQTIVLTPADKVIQRIKEVRSDIKVMGFKTTCGASRDGQVEAATPMLQYADVILMNDVETRSNVVMTSNSLAFHDDNRDDAIYDACETLQRL